MRIISHGKLVVINEDNKVKRRHFAAFSLQCWWRLVYHPEDVAEIMMMITHTDSMVVRKSYTMEHEK